MDTFTGRKLESGEHMNAMICGSTPKSRDAGNTVVIRDRDDLNSDLSRLLDNGRLMIAGISQNRLPAICRAVVVRIHLKCALVEYCALGKQTRAVNETV